MAMIVQPVLLVRHHVRIPILASNFPPLHPPPLPFRHRQFAEHVNVENSIHDEELISWVRPPRGFVKINTDATIRSNGKSGYGVVVRDHEGIWVTGCCGYYFGERFDRSFGPSSENIIQGEIRAVITALSVAIENGFSSVIIESDSKTVIDMINFNHDLDRHNRVTNGLITECWENASLIHVCVFQHKKREGNFCADKLAALGAIGKRKFEKFEHPPDQLIPYLVADYCGYAFRRGIKLTEQDIKQICESIS